MIDYESINRDLTNRAPGWGGSQAIRFEADYLDVLEEIDSLSGAPEGSSEENLLDVLTTLVAAYEAERN